MMYATPITKSRSNTRVIVTKRTRDHELSPHGFYTARLLNTKFLFVSYGNVIPSSGTMLSNGMGSAYPRAINSSARDITCDK